MLNPLNKSSQQQKSYRTRWCQLT